MEFVCNVEHDEIKRAIRELVERAHPSLEAVEVVMGSSSASVTLRAKPAPPMSDRLTRKEIEDSLSRVVPIPTPRQPQINPWTAVSIGPYDTPKPILDIKI